MLKRKRQKMKMKRKCYVKILHVRILRWRDFICMASSQTGMYVPLGGSGVSRRGVLRLWDERVSP